MQLGLVPIVTPVGEIQNYCKHGHNALFVESKVDVVGEILEIIEDESRYLELRKRAIETWIDKPLYAESVIQACKMIEAKY